MKRLPHPALVLSESPQLDSVIAGMTAGTYPLPDEPVWRGDLPRDLAVRLARATGASEEDIAGVTAAGQPQEP